jgi:hypothetical protein
MRRKTSHGRLLTISEKAALQGILSEETIWRRDQALLRRKKETLVFLQAACKEILLIRRIQR